MGNSIVRSWNNKTIRQRADGYVCLTDMAKASGKLFGHWRENKSANAYLEALSRSIGIPITELIQVFQGGTPEQQGTWGHPKVALRFAQWCSEEFAVQVDCWIDELLTAGSVSINEVPLHAVPSRDEAIADMKFMEAAADMLITAGLDPMLTKAHVLSQTARLYPALAPQIEAVKLLVPQQSQLQSNEILLNPTDVGARLDPPLSAKKVNSMLVLQGFQIRTGIKDAPYELTEKGKAYGKVTLNQAAGSDKTVQHVKWKASLVEALAA